MTWQGDTVRKCNLYLDAPIILKLIGIRAVATSTAAFSTFVSELRYRKEQSSAVFEHSRQEVMQILEGARQWMQLAGLRPDQSKQNGALHSDNQGIPIRRLSDSFVRSEETLKQHDISVYYRHEFVRNKQHQIDERLLLPGDREVVFLIPLSTSRLTETP